MRRDAQDYLAHAQQEVIVDNARLKAAVQYAQLGAVHRSVQQDVLLEHKQLELGLTLADGGGEAGRAVETEGRLGRARAAA